ncbi:hypothetical protein AX16_001604 [Volvariella volvacea WC 439]|nr:hypothetical protein AX16_001604 [Volvariella volvacea WC 439]
MDLPEWNNSMPQDPNRRWGWFIGIAVVREGQCVDENNLPPPDIMMVWHAYLLNPQ